MMAPKKIEQQSDPATTQFIKVKAGPNAETFRTDETIITGSRNGYAMERVSSGKVPVVVLWDRDLRHPNGIEVMIKGDDVVEVFPTSRVKEYLAAEKLVKVD